MVWVEVLSSEDLKKYINKSGACAEALWAIDEAYAEYSKIET